MPPRNLRLAFLGTCSGGGPLINRNCSSCLIDIQNGPLYMVDCAEGTKLQLMKSGVKMARLSKIFITHLHADHCLGIVPLLSNVISGCGDTSRTDTRIELFGPSGLRRLLRVTMEITQLRLNGKYAVHELLSPGDTPFPCNSTDLCDNEAPGRDIYADPVTGLWENFWEADGFNFDAAPIQHRIKCLGYVFREKPRTGKLNPALWADALERNRAALQLPPYNLSHPNQVLNIIQTTCQPFTLPDQTVLYPPEPPVPRKLVILGDTSDPTAIRDLAMDATLLVHEATNAYIPHSVASKSMGGNSEAVVRARAISRGHSTAAMAGEFAKSIRARRLVLNHFSARFPPGDYYGSANPISRHRDSTTKASYKTEPSKLLREIERQATQAWHDESVAETVNAYGRDDDKWGSAIAAWDYMFVDIGEHEPMKTNWQAEIGSL